MYIVQISQLLNRFKSSHEFMLFFSFAWNKKRAHGTFIAWKKI